MPFKEVDIEKLIEEEKVKDPEFAKTFDAIEKEYDLIGELVQKRKSQGLSQKDLADKLGVRQQVISRIERKKQSTTVSSLVKMGQELGLELQWK